jgi:hypothetical protein
VSIERNIDNGATSIKAGDRDEMDAAVALSIDYMLKSILAKGEICLTEDEMGNIYHK